MTLPRQWRKNVSESARVVRIMPKSVALMVIVRQILGKDCTIDQSQEEYFDVETSEDHIDLMDLVQESANEKELDPFDWELVPK